MQGGTNAGTLAAKVLTANNTQSVSAFTEYGFGLAQITIPANASAIISVQATGKTTEGRLTILGIYGGINTWLASGPATGQNGDVFLSGTWITKTGATTQVAPKIYQQGDAAANFTCTISALIFEGGGRKLISRLFRRRGA